MKKAVFFSLFTILLITLVLIVNPSFVNAAQDNELVIVTNFDDNFVAPNFHYYIYASVFNENNEPYVGEITYEIEGQEPETLNLENGTWLMHFQGDDNKKITIQGIPKDYKYKISVEDSNSHYFQNKAVFYELTNEEGVIKEDNDVVKIDTKVKTFNFEFRLHATGNYDKFEFPIYVVIHQNSIINPKNAIKYRVVRDGKVVKTGLADKPGSEIAEIEKIWLRDGDSLFLDDLPDGNENWHYTYYDGDFKDRYGFYRYNFDYFLPTYSTKDNMSNSVEYYKVANINFPTLVDSRLMIEKKSDGKGIEKDKEFIFKIKGWYESLIEENKSDAITGKYPYTKYKIKEESNQDDPSQTITSYEEIEKGTLKFDDKGIGYAKLKADERIIVGENSIWVDDDGNALEEEPNISHMEAFIKKYEDHCFMKGARFEVSEVDANGYDVKIDKSDYKYDDYDKFYTVPFTITNTRKFTGKLTINKQTIGDALDKNREFMFKIKLEDGAEDIPKTYKYIGSKEGMLEFDENFQSTITLKGGESITIEGLPVDAKYEVLENDYSDEGYVTSSDGANGKIKDGKGSVVTFTNQKGNIEEVPQTVDSINIWIGLFILSILGIILNLFALRRKYLKA